jgi:hypothetical protein
MPFGDDELDVAARRMLAVQRATGFNLSENMMLVGLPGQTAMLNGVEWKKNEYIWRSSAITSRASVWAIAGNQGGPNTPQFGPLPFLASGPILTPCG